MLRVPVAGSARHSARNSLSSFSARLRVAGGCAVNSATTTSDETAMIQEEFDGDSLVVLAGTRAASRTEGSPEELGIGST